MRLVAMLALVASALVGRVALAQDDAPPPDDHFQTAAARAAFLEGVALARTGDYAGAEDRFRRAQVLHPAPTVAFNLASALVHRGGLVEACEILEGVLRDPASTEELRAQARRQRDAITPRLARLTLRLDGPVAGVRVEIDAREVRLAALGVAVPIDPGLHEVRALREGRDAASDHIELAEGESRELSLVIPSPELHLERILEEPTTPAPPPPIVASGDDTLMIVLGVSVGIVAVAAITTTAIVLTLPSAPAEVSGNTVPPVLTW